MMTGGEVPSGADTVVPFEQTEPSGENRIHVVRARGKGDQIRSAGRDARSGEIVLPAALTIRRAGGTIPGIVPREPAMCLTNTKQRRSHDSRF